MTDTQTEPLAVAELLAPVPTSRDSATHDDWLRHYAATALAAHATFLREMRHIPKDGPGRPELGYLAALSATAVGAVVALTEEHDVAGYLYDATPGYGANNGEDMERITAVLDRLGINPADIDPRYQLADFRSPSQLD